MNDDLISRKDLIGTERLLMTDIVENNEVAKYILEQVLHDIEHAPIAFDKEKVIDELKEMATHSASCKNQCEFGSTEYFDYMGAEAAYKTTIEIVEKGGIE